MMYDPRYVAGVLDSDGSIFIQRAVRPNGRVRYNAKATISQYREDDLMEWLAETFGGSSFCYPSRGYLNEWIACGSSALPFLDWVLPHLHLKKRQAEIAREWGSRVTNTGRSLPVDMQEYQAQAYVEMASLNTSQRHRDRAMQVL